MANNIGLPRLNVVPAGTQRTGLTRSQTWTRQPQPQPQTRAHQATSAVRDAFKDAKTAVQKALTDPNGKRQLAKDAATVATYFQDTH